MLQFVGAASGAGAGGTPATPQLEALEGHEEHFQVAFIVSSTSDEPTA